MKVTALVENTKNKEGLKAEHGLSLYIETEKYRILFDMGQTELFAKNAELLGIDLSTVDIAILSHGHYDHGGGLKRFLEINKKAPVYLSQYAFGEHFHGEMKYIGLDQSLKRQKRLFFTKDTYEITKEIILYTAPIPKKYPLPSSDLMEKKGDKFEEDDFRHEQYLLIKEKKKQILFSGCSHNGILDIAEYFCPDYLIGGFHFSKFPPDQMLEEYCKHLNRYPIKYFTCHCTGVEQYHFMREKMKNLFYLSGGDTLEIRS